jgi:hypothetical protein
VSTASTPASASARARRWLKRQAGRFTTAAQEARLEWPNRLLRRRVTGTSDVVVSLTTHGPRVNRVHVTIESICAGTVRPARLILWLNPGPETATLPRALVGLQARGLEVKYVDNFGPHTKYFPYVASEPQHTRPLVTADDDVIYPRDWLERLLDAHLAQPAYVHCYRARRVVLDGSTLAPYNSWGFDTTGAPSLLNFATGVAGVIYPPAMLQRLKECGDAFRAVCPKADDLWLHVIAIRNGFRIKQLAGQAVDHGVVRGTPASGLYHFNVIGTGNDAQIAKTYTAQDLQTLIAESAESRTAAGSAA